MIYKLNLPCCGGVIVLFLPRQSTSKEAFYREAAAGPCVGLRKLVQGTSTLALGRLLAKRWTTFGRNALSVHFDRRVAPGLTV